MFTAEAIQNMLKYQTIDGELVKIERNITNSQDKQTVSKMVEIFNNTKKEADSLEAEASRAVERFNTVKAVYEENYEKAKKLSSLDVEKLTDAQLEKVSSELDVILGNLNGIEKDLVSLNSDVENILTRFEASKQRAVKAKDAYTVAKTKYDTFYKEASGNMQRYVDVLKKMQPVIDGELLKRYLALRNDNIFPILVKLDNSMCSACRMSQSVTTVNKIRAEGVCVCESCRRLMYIENK